MTIQRDTYAHSATTAARAGIATDTQWGAVVPPIHLSANYTFDGLGGKRQYDYGRGGNPTRDLLAGAIADLEEGAGAVVTSSGMAAVALVLHLLEPGQLLVAPHDCYGGTIRLINALSARGHFDVCCIDQSDADALEDAFSHAPRLCWVETPSNPLLRITDLGHVRRLCAAANTLLAVDNTFLSPALQKPIRFGADFVVHSTTKYLNGHSDVVGGVVVAADNDRLESLAWWANCLGITGAAFDSFLTLRGLRTLHARIAAHERNALAIVDALARRDVVRKIYHPSLSAHPGHDIAQRQQHGSGAMVSFELEGDTAAVRAFVDGLRHFTLAESLGGVESLIAHPVTMTHAAMEPQARALAGLSDSLLRLSVGIEDADDLVADIEAALDRAESAAAGAAVTGGRP